MQIEEIYQKIQRIFPNQKIEEEANGWCSWAFSVDNKIIRIPKVSIDGYLKESKVLSFLKQYVSVEIPQTIVCKDTDFSYVSHKKLVGNKWNSATYNELNQKNKKLFCQDIAIFFSEIHGIPINVIQKDFPSLKGINSSYNINKTLKLLKNEFSLREISKLQDKIKEVQNTQDDEVLIHRDFHSGNSLIDTKHRLKGVFDFVNCGIYDRHYEFLTFFYETEMEMLKNIADIYKDITSKKVDLNKLSILKIIDDLGALDYLEENLKIKNEKIKSFNEIALRVHKQL